MPLLPIVYVPHVLYLVEEGKRHPSRRGICVSRQECHDLAPNPSGEKCHGFGIKGRHQMALVNFLKIVRHGHSHANTFGAEGICAKSSVENVVLALELADSGVLTTVTFPFFFLHNKLLTSTIFEVSAVRAYGVTYCRKREVLVANHNRITHGSVKGVQSFAFANG